MQDMADAASRSGGFFSKSLGEMFTDSEEFKALVASGSGNQAKPWAVEGRQARDITRYGTYGQKDIYTGMVSDAVNPRGFGTVQFDPIVPRQQRAYRVRSLFPVATTTSNLIEFFRVLGFAENGGQGNAQPVAEWDANASPSATFATKPKSNLQFEAAQASVRTLAHWEAAHRNVLADVPQLQSIINNELLYGLALEEDDQILNGDGTGENLLGIMNTPGIQQYTQINGDLKSDALRRAATLSALAYFPSNGYVLHPFDWEDIELQKGNIGSGTAGDGQYMLFTNIAIGASAQIWRQPVVESPAMTQGEFLTGAFGLGAQLYDREQANVRIAEQHANFFVQNAVAVLVEERLALAVKRPESFIAGKFL
jgi:HK97 family phage major capsid protein